MGYDFRIFTLVLATVTLTIFMSISVCADDGGLSYEKNPRTSYPIYNNPVDIPHEAFLNFDKMQSIIMSPDGQHFIVVVRDGAFLNISIQTLDETDTEQHIKTKLSIAGYHSSFWVSNKRIIIQTNTLIQTNNRRNPFLLSQKLTGLDINGENQSKLYAGLSNTSLSSFILNVLPEDPDHILIQAMETSNSYPSVHKLNVLDGTTTKVREPLEFIHNWFVDPAGIVRLGLGVKDNKLFFIARDNKGGEWHNLQDNELFVNGKFEPITFADDDVHMYVRSASATGKWAFYLFNIDTGKITKKLFEHHAVDVNSIELEASSNRLLAIMYYGEKTERKFFDAAYKKMVASIKEITELNMIEAINSTHDGRYWMVTAGSAQSMGKYFRVDTHSNSIRKIGEANVKVNPDQLSEMEAVSYFARDGLELPAYLTVPKGSDGKNLPTIILPHQGIGSRNYYNYHSLVQFLSSRGYAVFQPNYRGSGGYGYKQQLLANDGWGGSAYNDLIDGIDYLIEEGVTNKNRVCIIGLGDFSGYHALLSTYKDAQKISCAVTMGAVTDLRKWIKEFKKAKRKSDVLAIGGSRDKATLKKLSPIENIKHINKPVLMFHGSKDTWVSHKNYYDSFEKKIKRAKKNIKFVDVNGDGNRPSTASGYLHLMKEIEPFLQKYIGSDKAK